MTNTKDALPVAENCTHERFRFGAKDECQEQARIIGMGAERELALMAKLERSEAKMQRAEAHLAEAQRDAERFRWIDENATSRGGGNGFWLSVFVPADVEDLGCAIDAARASAGGAV